MVRKMIKIVVRMFWTASICSPFTSRMMINFLWILLPKKKIILMAPLISQITWKKLCVGFTFWKSSRSRILPKNDTFNSG
jgi:hypothetical protein